MDKGKYQYDSLVSTYSREFLMSTGKDQGIMWKEDKDDSINWFRFSQALMGFLRDGQQLDLDNVDEDTAQQMLDHYTGIRDLHKQSMIPHLRDAMSKMYSEAGNSGKSPSDYVSQAYEHLENKGGRVWANKMDVLNHINGQISKLQAKIPKAEDATEGGATTTLKQ